MLQRSILGQILPEAMVWFLENYGKLNNCQTFSENCIFKGVYVEPLCCKIWSEIHGSSEAYLNTTFWGNWKCVN